ncbi:MAG: valine--tRNA ligase [Candidatus Woesearchaeota archaeon]
MENYDFLEAEKRILDKWIKQGIYKFDKESNKPIFSIDTPPPTVSGKMHIGHAFSFCQQDFIARFKRMKGFNVFQPFGTDDNGLATERLIEKINKTKATKMDRHEFSKLCLNTLETQLRPEYVQDWKNIGMSCDWDIFYTTINEESIKISQLKFLDLIKKNRAYRKEAPVIWCPQCATALSQVEVEDIELDSSFNDIVFNVDGKELIIATTRPELLPACVAVIYNPEDDRYKHLKDKKAKVPLFNFEVPILEDSRVMMDKGTGIVMCCTFGDQTDMEWQKAFDLPIKTAFTPDGKMTEIADNYKGLTIKEARKEIINDLKEKKLLINQKPIKHPVNTHERCSTEVEFMHSKQWFIKYLDLKDEFIKRGNELNWYPKHMKNRYDNWVKGLQWDWCISRQRFSGVPFPVWYKKDTLEPIYADEDQLPVDPLKDLPKGYSKDEIIAEKDIMDTWATSSLTPHLSTYRFKNEKFYDQLYPMNLRPQAHDIITFWLFNTVVRSHIHENSLPFKDVMISGWALDPKGKKMSKSKGNVIAPQDILNKFGADALRYWAAGSKLGEDVPYQEKDIVTGKKTVTKLWNASKFAHMHLKDYNNKIPQNLQIMDKWILSKINKIIKISTESFDKYEYSKTRLEVDNFFWNIFCDYYLEIIKDRLYNPDRRGKDEQLSALYSLNKTLINVLKLFAPIMPYVTDEIYTNFSKENIHVSKWPEYEENLVNEDIEKIGDAFIKILGLIRKHKSDNNLSLKVEIDKIKIYCNKDLIEGLNEAIEDLKSVSKVKEIVFEESEEIKVEI